MAMHRLGLLDALRALRAGTLDPAAYREACLDRARSWEPRLHAFAHLDAAAAVDAPGAPLAGIPVAIKDIVATRDMPTTNGSPIHAGDVPRADAEVVARLRALGATIFGKTVSTEFAFRHPGPTRNPWNPGHTPGGSSSGSAAAVAAGIVPLALGTQTMGSVIRPAAFCGVVGFKPSYGAIPRTGVHPLAGSLDHVGFFTRAVADAAYALSLLAAASDADPHGLPLPPFRVGTEADLDIDLDLDLGRPPRLALMRTSRWSEVEGAQQDLLLATAERLRMAGAVVVETEWPQAFDALWTIAAVILAAEASATFGPLRDRWPTLVSEPLAGLIAEGRAVPAPDYVAALRRQRDLRAGLGRVLDGFDAVLTVPAPGAAPEGLASTGDPGFNVPWTCLGAPALTLPVGFADSGLPLGIQLCADYRQDLRLLRVGRWCEAAIGREVRFPA